MTEVKTFFGRVGGKARIAPWIIEHIKRHNFSIYVEPFAGSGAVYFRMVNDKIFETIRARGKFPRIVLNDADSSIVKIFKACRDYPELLAHAIHYTPYSREEHAIAQGKRPQLNPDENLQNLLADIEEARQLLVNIWQSFKSSPGDSWGTNTGIKREGSRPNSCLSASFSNLPDRILAASPHLQRNFEVDLMNVIQALDDMMNHPDVVKKQVEEARQALVNIWQSFNYLPGNRWGTSTGIQREGSHGDTSLSSIFSNLPDRILAASPHLQRNFEIDLMNVIQALDDMMNHPDVVKEKVEEARQALVNIWQSFKYSPGDSWGTTTGMHREGSKPSHHCSSSIFSKLPDRILAASPHLQRNFEVDLMNVIQALDDMMNHPDVVKKQVEEARQALVNIWQSFKYSPGDSWGTSTGIQRERTHSDRCSSASFSNLPERIMNATTALKSCYIENDDALKVMQRWSTKQTLFYLDPPYVSCESYYEYNKTRGKDAAIELHYNLASLANSIECAGIVLSYYPNELLDELYPEEFWERHYKSVLASSAGITRTSKNQNRPERTELLLVRKKTNTEIKANYQGQLSLL